MKNPLNVLEIESDRKGAVEEFDVEDFVGRGKWNEGETVGDGERLTVSL